MKKSFIYEKQSSMSIWPMLAFAVIAVLCVVFKYGIAIKNFTLLQYPYSAIIAAVIAAGFGAYYFSEKKKAKASKANPDRIETDETGIKFSSKKGEVVIAYADVTQLWHKEEDGDVLAIIYTASDDRYEWAKDGFATGNEFDEFEEILNEYCTNITNR
jgi:hypothetical protein